RRVQELHADHPAPHRARHLRRRGAGEEPEGPVQRAQQEFGEEIAALPRLRGRCERPTLMEGVMTRDPLCVGYLAEWRGGTASRRRSTARPESVDPEVRILRRSEEQ